MAYYYAIWATQCLSKNHKHTGDELTNDEINNFLRYLSKRHEDWQVKQASDAIWIYNFYAKTKTSSIRDYGKPTSCSLIGVHL